MARPPRREAQRDRPAVHPPEGLEAAYIVRNPALDRDLARSRRPPIASELAAAGSSCDPPVCRGRGGARHPGWDAGQPRSLRVQCAERHERRCQSTVLLIDPSLVVGELGPGQAKRSESGGG